VIVPTVGIVIGDDDGGVFPLAGLLQEIGDSGDEGLFVSGSE
jgi:hypothetical protein